MTDRTARWIFWAGTLSSLALFLALTLDTHRQFDALTHADRLDETVVAGKRAFERHGCNDCHTILGFGAYYAPDLTRVHGRLGEDAIRRRLRQPEVVFAASFRKMPHQAVTEEEVESLVAFFRWVDGIENGDWPPQHSVARWKRSTERMLAGAAVSPAAALVKQEGCLACHALGDAGGELGPRLEYTGIGRDVPWIADYLANPEAVSPGAAMPAFDHLSAEQRALLGQFLVSLSAERR